MNIPEHARIKTELNDIYRFSSCMVIHVYSGVDYGSARQWFSRELSYDMESPSCLVQPFEISHPQSISLYFSRHYSRYESMLETTQTFSKEFLFRSHEYFIRALFGNSDVEIWLWVTRFEIQGDLWTKAHQRNVRDNTQRVGAEKTFLLHETHCLTKSRRQQFDKNAL